MGPSVACGKILTMPARHLDGNGTLAAIKDELKVRIGVLARTAGGRRGCRPFPLEVGNVSGGGDAFGGALCHVLLADVPRERVLRFANVAGAIVASRLECSTAMPTDREVERLMREQVSGEQVSA